MREPRYWDDVSEGTPVSAIEFPLTLHRLVVEAGGNRDFATVHHNANVAEATGAPDCFANNVFIQGMFERAVREFIGMRGVIRKIGPFRMHTFLMPGRTAVVSSSVRRKWEDDGGQGLVEMFVQIQADDVVAASGTVTAALPRRG